jgi:hypothetical protein
MTKIDHEHPVVRETDATYRDRNIVVEIHPRHIVFRVKGLRTVKASLGIEGALDRALIQQAENQLAIGGAGKRRTRQKLSLIHK